MNNDLLELIDLNLNDEEIFNRSDLCWHKATDEDEEEIPFI